MKRSEIIVGGKYGDGKGRTRKVLDAGHHVLNPQFRHALDNDNVLYEDGKGNKGIMTRTRFATWAKLIIAFLLLLVPLAVFAAPKTKPLPKLVVAEMKSATGGVDSRLFKVAEEQIANEISKTGKFSVVGRDDINRMLDSMQSKQMMGCTDTECYAQIGGAMGADLMVAGTVDRIGSTYLITVKLINIASAEVLARESEKIRNASPEEIVSAAQSLVERMFTPRRPYKPWKWAAVGTSAVTLLTGAVCVGVGVGKTGEAQDMVKNSKTSRVLYADFKDTESLGSSLQTAGYVLFGVGAVAGAASVVLFWLDKAPVAGPVGVGPVAMDSYYGIVVNGRF